VDPVKQVDFLDTTISLFGGYQNESVNFLVPKPNLALDSRELASEYSEPI